jgi:hypothetical protein
MFFVNKPQKRGEKNRCFFYVYNIMATPYFI